MTLLEELLEGNTRFREIYLKYADRLPTKPKKKLAIITCIDTRLNPIRIFHINVGDAVILRNAGNQVTDDIIRSLIIAIASGVNEIVILGHTDCFLTKLTPLRLALSVQEQGGTIDVTSLITSKDLFTTFSNAELNVRVQVQKLRNNPIIPKNIPVHGLLFHVNGGELKVIVNGYEPLVEKPSKVRTFAFEMPDLKMPSLSKTNILGLITKIRKDTESRS